MDHKPTVVGTEDQLGAQLASQQIQDLVPVNTGAIVVRTDQLPAVQAAVEALDFETLPAASVIQLGLEAEQGLHKTLDGFLSRLDKKIASQVFKLFNTLEGNVEDAKLPELLKRIQQGNQLGLFQSLLAWLKLIDKEQLVQKLSDEVSEMINGRTRTLADEMKSLESELTTEMKKLFTELQVLDSLKRSYGEHFGAFTFQAAVANAFLQKAKAYVEAQASAAQPNDMMAQARVRELQNKLRLLESRALALEGVYTRLPADALVIQQLEQAGISTLQETATTIASRFASIKMTLLALHGVFAVGNVQQMSEKQAKLDKQLTDLRADAMNQVTTTAAAAPGQNRLAQAEQVRDIITSTAELQTLIVAAEQKSDVDFEAARKIFAQAREDMAALNKSR